MTLKGCILLNDEAISPVLGTVLILAIGMTLLTTVQVSFMPVWNAEEELNHLEKMNDDFKELKSSIESNAVSGTALSSPLSMGFKYSQKIIGYNPRERAYATFNIQKDTWAEVRYNEMLTEGMDDATSIKNITSSTITYSLLTPQNLSPFIYEHGLIRRGGSNYTAGAQSLVTNGSLYLLGVNATEPEATTSAERRVINIYPTSPAKNSIIGKKVWLTLHTKYVDWWADDPNNPSSIQNLGGTIKKKDSVNGNIIAFFDRMEIRMGETQVTSRSKKPPSRLPQYRLVKVSPQNVNLPVEGMNALAVEVQDYYNNPVPNVQVNFSINSTRGPTNAYLTANLSQNSAISGADGRANIMLRTSGPGIYYIEAGIPTYNTTFTYPASSQGGFISLAYTGAEPTYTITATLRNATGEPWGDQTINFSSSNGTINPTDPTTVANGNASTTLNTSTAGGLKITNIQTADVTNSSANITWDTVNTITVAANRTPGGYIFGNIDVQTRVNSAGCVRYGTSPGNYPYLSSCDSNTASHSITLTNLQQYTAYYFIVNSSRSGGASINSSEYMFVTEPAADTTPPASVTSLINETYEPLFIRWAWADPADADFKEVQVYIDGVSNGTVAKGVQAFNASYFRPNSTHTISTRTVDTSSNVNATWVNWTANTSSVFTYVFDFLNITGTVTNFDNARNASDGGASALFNESLSGGTAESNNYTYVTSYTAANGTVTSFANMQSAVDGGAFANLTEGSSGGVPGGTSNAIASVIGATDNTGDTLAALQANDTSGASPGSVITTDGWYTVLKGKIMYIDGFNTSGMSGSVTAATLKMEYSVETGYGGTNPIRWGREGYALNTTGIIPASGEVSVTRSYDLYAQGINNLADIAALNVEFTSNDPSSPQAVSFDYVWIEVTYSGGAATYSMNITTNTTSVPVETNYYLEIYYRRDANETGYNVSVYNGTAWNYKGNLTSLAWFPANFTLSSSEVINGNVSVRYIDQTPAGSTQGNLSIDYQRIHGCTPATPAAYRLEVITNTTSIPDAANQTLQLRYNVSNDTFIVQVWNGSEWEYRTTLDDIIISYRDITLLPGDLQSDGAFTGGSVGDLNKYYVRVRYTDVDASASQQGRLYLDYQRVYST